MMFFLDVALLVLIVLGLYWFATKRSRRHRTITEDSVALPGASLDVSTSPLFRFPKAPKGSKPYYLCFDTETCRMQPEELSPLDDAVVPSRAVVLSYALLDAKGRIIVSRSRLIRADEEVTDEAEAKHGISNERMHQSGEQPADVYADFARCFAAARIVVAHYLFFHKTIVDTDCRHYGLPPLQWNNTMALCSMKQGQAFTERLGLNPTHKLPKLSELYGMLYFRNPQIALTYTQKGEADLKLLIASLRYMIDAD